MEQYREWVLKHLNIGKELLYLTKSDCKAANISHEEIFLKTEEALKLYSNQEVEMPAKTSVHPIEDSAYYAMPISMPTGKDVGVKWCAGYGDNPRRFGLPSVSGLIIYNDYESGWPIAVMDCLHIMDCRTPAVTFVCAKHMGEVKASAYGLIGCGVQGKNHLGIVEETLKDLKEIYIFDEVQGAMDAVITEYQPKISVPIRKAKSYEELVKSCEIITSAVKQSRNPKPAILDEWIGKGQTIITVDMHPLFEAATTKRADKYLVDSIEQQLLTETYGYYPQGLPPIYGEIGEVVAGCKKGRENKEELIFCNNTGFAAEDFPLARMIFDKALKDNLGIKLPL